jgi:hypothetical protein
MTTKDCSENQTREGQVTQELARAENAANRLVTKIDELEMQLSIVLQNDKPLASTPNKEAEQVLVPLASRIREHHEILHYQGSRLGEMLDRLEIR